MEGVVVLPEIGACEENFSALRLWVFVQCYCCSVVVQDSGSLWFLAVRILATPSCRASVALRALSG